MATWAKVVMLSAVCLAAAGVAGVVYGNGGPFVIQYPDGDPAAKGVLARLDPDLKPARIEDLRVIQEDLTFVVLPKEAARQEQGTTESGKAVTLTVPAPATPLVQVSAAYTIENPADREIVVDFGFPILRGVYLSWGMEGARPDVQVRMAQAGTDPAKAQHLAPQMITNSVIYGVIRQRARQAIDKAVADNADLTKLAGAVKDAAADQRETAKAQLAEFMVKTLQWNERDAALMAEYAGLVIGEQPGWARDASPVWVWGLDRGGLTHANLGPLAAIGEQKATQFFAQLANGFDPTAGAAYEAIFSAWGGDVREQSVDLRTGRVRPREITVDPKNLGLNPRDAYGDRTVGSDPTVYARVDYLDETAKITGEEKDACWAILKNLPVVFTFAPMNLLYYQAKFPAKSTVVLTVSYRQYAYADTAEPASCQMAYVLHPASMWKEFGPIHLEVRVPAGVPFRASVQTLKEAATVEGEVSKRDTSRLEPRPASSGPGGPDAMRPFDVHRATIQQKTGELFLAVDTAGWDKTAPPDPVQAEAPAAAPSGDYSGETKVGGGTLTLTGGGMFTGATIIESGALKLIGPTTQPDAGDPSPGGREP